MKLHYAPAPSRFSPVGSTVYPPENEALFRRIVEDGGCGVSEMKLGWEPRARDFPRRNRIIAGMALAVIVVEAAERSGSLITARLALEQNREVLAVPGSPLRPAGGGKQQPAEAGGAAGHRCSRRDRGGVAASPTSADFGC